jgi:hypothetical protein
MKVVFGDIPLKLGDVKNIVHDGLLAEAICVGHGANGTGLFIQQIDSHTDPEEIEIYDVAPNCYFDDTDEGRAAAVEQWSSQTKPLTKGLGNATK